MCEAVHQSAIVQHGACTSPSLLAKPDRDAIPGDTDRGLGGSLCGIMIPFRDLIAPAKIFGRGIWRLFPLLPCIGGIVFGAVIVNGFSGGICHSIKC